MDWVKYIVVGLFALILGSYSYTTFSSGKLEDRLVKRLDRIEEKLDKLLAWGE